MGQQHGSQRASRQDANRRAAPAIADRPDQHLQREESGSATVRRALTARLTDLASGDMLTLQQTIGNRAVLRLSAHDTPAQSGSRSTSLLPVQARLTVGPAGDAYEQEADRVAAQVVSRVDTPPASGGSVRRRQPGDEDEELNRMPAIGRQATALDGLPVSAELETIIQSQRGRGQPLSDGVRTSMENAFGSDFGGVRVHTGAQADALSRSVQARAFTTGRDIFFGDGQYAPASQAGQQLLAHELTHVVQQNGPAKIQRSVDTAFGAFDDQTYTEINTGQAIGVKMKLEFTPNANVDATKIGLTQSIKAYSGGSPSYVQVSDQDRIVSSGPGEGYVTDRVETYNTPIYGSKSLGGSEGLEKTEPTNAPPSSVPNPGVNATYELGHRYIDSGAVKEKKAWLYDAPQRAKANNAGQIFETTALALDGSQKGTYYGSVQWGWTTDGSGTYKKLDLSLVSEGAPSANFIEPAKKWNASRVRGTVVAKADGTNVYKGNLSVDFTIEKDTQVQIQGSVAAGSVSYASVKVLDGPHATKTGYVKMTDLKDKGDGVETVDLPLPNSTDYTNINVSVEDAGKYTFLSSGDIKKLAALVEAEHKKNLWRFIMRTTQVERLFDLMVLADHYITKKALTPSNPELYRDFVDNSEPEHRAERLREILGTH